MATEENEHIVFRLGRQLIETANVFITAGEANNIRLLCNGDEWPGYKVVQVPLRPLRQSMSIMLTMPLPCPEGGHDWWHIHRVWKLSKHIAETEQVDLFIVELGALLHDIADSKFHDGDETIGPRKARLFLSSIEIEEEVIVHIENIISNISFKSGKHNQNFRSPELDVIQDADRLDSMGAIGIARTFSYGGYKNRGIYDPDFYPNLDMTKEEYKNSSAPSLNHFYEKFLDEFFQEWNGEL